MTVIRGCPADQFEYVGLKHRLLVIPDDRLVRRRRRRHDVSTTAHQPALPNGMRTRAWLRR
jgi:hypothetical protein